MPASSTSRWKSDEPTPGWSHCLVASTSTHVSAVVLRVSSRRRAAKREARGAVHLRGGRLVAAAAVAVAADAAEGVLRRGT